MASPLPLLLVAGVAAWALTRSSGPAPAPETPETPETPEETPEERKAREAKEAADRAAKEAEARAAAEEAAGEERRRAAAAALAKAQADKAEADRLKASIGKSVYGEAPAPTPEEAASDALARATASLLRKRTALSSTGVPLGGSSEPAPTSPAPTGDDCASILDDLTGQAFRFVPLLVGKRIDDYARAYLGSRELAATLVVNLSAEYAGRIGAGSSGSATLAIGRLADCLRARYKL